MSSVPEEFYVLENFTTVGYDHEGVENQWLDIRQEHCTTIINN